MQDETRVFVACTVRKGLELIQQSSRGFHEGKSITRQYTPVTDVTLRGSFQLLIKVYKDGRMSDIVRQWKEGDWLDIRGPFGNLQYTPNEYRQILMLAAGTGIAPMAQLIQAALSDDKEEGRIRLLYACRTYGDILMKKEIQEWQQFWNFSALFVLSQESLTTSGSNYAFGEEIVRGRITLSLLQRELADNFSAMRILVCGTRSFDSDMLQMLDECNFPKQCILRF